MTTKPKRSKASKAALSPKGMGGIIARRGFGFQDYWLLYKAVTWLSNPLFQGFMSEGADDVDVHWTVADAGLRSVKRGDREVHRYQLKDTILGKRALSDILASFYEDSKRWNDTWAQYHIIASASVAELRFLPAAINRVREIRVAYANSAYWRNTEDTFAHHLKALGISADARFIYESVSLDFSVTWPRELDHVIGNVRAHLQCLGVAPNRTDAACKTLLYELRDRQVGQLVSRNRLEALIESYRSMTEQPKSVVATPIEPRHLSDDPCFGLDIFPGNCTMVHLPDGETGIIESGSGADRVLQEISRRRIKGLSFVTVSHWHADHFCGVLSLLSGVNYCRRVFIPAYNGSLNNDQAPTISPMVNRLIERLKDMKHRLGMEIVILHGTVPIYSARTTSGIQVGVTAFGPNKHLLSVQNDIRCVNDTCAVFRINVNERAFLITGDATRRAWENVVTQSVDGKIDVLTDGMIIPQHGHEQNMARNLISQAARSTGLIAVVEPALRYGLPRPEVLAAYHKAGANILMCDRQPVRLKLDGKGIWAKTVPREEA